MFIDVLPRDDNGDTRFQTHKRGFGGAVDYPPSPSRSSWPFPVAASWQEGLHSNTVDGAMAMKADACAVSSFVT
ncbi:hypothetical protein [Polaromonas sp.]|uniref:hypothetical protein n=1 Tax=Polaromonas sp. TaxID=1869339 RepID=UPI0032659596